MPTRSYLARLGIDAPLPPTLDSLFLLHQRHQERVPYENLAIMLGAPPSVDPESCLDRVGRIGRAGYCFHHNAALELVLADLGFAVERRHGHVWSDEEDRHGTSLDHLVLVVTGLPTSGNPGGRWWVDVGLGDGFRLPLPLVAGAHVQDGFCYRLDDVREGGWTFHHDPSGSFAGVEVRDRAVGALEVLAAHAELSAPAEGRFARFVIVQRRTADGTTTLRGRTLHRQSPRGTTTTELTSYDAWWAALVDDLRVPIDDLDEDELRALHARSR